MKIDFDPNDQIWDEKTKQYLRPKLDSEIGSSKIVAKDNLQICKTCDRFDPRWRICNECGCQMDLKGIVYRLLNKSPCPLKKW